MRFELTQIVMRKKLLMRFGFFVQGTLDQFDYPKKGKNIPPSKKDRPPTSESEKQRRREFEER